MLMAREMGVQLRTSSGPVLEKPGDLVGLLTSLGAGDMLFIDEIHRLKPALEEFLYPAMEDFRVDVRIAEGPARPDDPHGARALHPDRRDHPLRPAHPADARPLRPGRAAGLLSARRPAADRRADRPRFCRCRSTTEGADEIARRSRGTPRVANRLLRRVRDYAQVRADGRITAAVAGAALARLNVDEFGLDDMDARILTTIIEKFGGGPVGLGTVAVAVGEDAGTLEDVYEPYPDPAGLPRAHAEGPVRHRDSPTAASASRPPAGQATFFDR